MNYLKELYHYNSGPVQSCSFTHEQETDPPHSQDVIISKTYLWIGASKGFIGDLHFEVHHENGDLIDLLQWDHYTDPTLPTGRWEHHAGGWLLTTGQRLKFTRKCSPVTGYENNKVHFLSYIVGCFPV